MDCIRIAQIALYAALLVALPDRAGAQSHPVVDLFAGYSLLPANGDDYPRQTSHGLQVGVTGHLTEWFGLFADVGAQFDRSNSRESARSGREATVTVYELLAGPRLTARFEGLDVFAHGLVGLATGDAGPGFAGFSDSGLTFGGGGGTDIRVTPRVAARIQYDLIGSFADIVEGNSRFAVGVVVRMGGR
jgi:opacity protein-like surface antigen